MPELFSFSLVTSKFAADAFAFHALASSSDDHIWPRTSDFIYQLALNNELFGVTNSAGSFVALCYGTLNESANEWEIGGLMVEPSLRRTGIGTLLVRLVIAHVLAYNQPWANKQEVVAYVHEENNAPRALLKHLGFEYRGETELSPEADAPATMKRNADGKLIGDKFEFTRESLRSLSRWFDEESVAAFKGEGWDGTIQLGPIGLENLKTALRELATEDI